MDWSGRVREKHLLLRLLVAKRPPVTEINHINESYPKHLKHWIYGTKIIIFFKKQVEKTSRFSTPVFISYLGSN